MTGTGPLMAFETSRLLRHPSTWREFGYPPSVSWLHPLPCNSMSAPHRCHHRFSSTTSHASTTLLRHPGFFSWSSGFSPPHRHRASLVLTHQYSPWICHPLTPHRFGVSLSVRFSNASHSIDVRPGGLPWVRCSTSPYPVQLHFGSVHRILGLALPRLLDLLPAAI